jgi:hypothetical protein
MATFEQLRDPQILEDSAHQIYTEMQQPVPDGGNCGSDNPSTWWSDSPKSPLELKLERARAMQRRTADL